jgi:hypothetical protein
MYDAAIDTAAREEKAMAAKGKDTEQEEVIEHDKKSIAQIRKVLARFVENAPPVEPLVTQWCDTRMG